MRKIWNEEIEKIERELAEYCYDFPYDIVTDVKEMFDDSRAEHNDGLLQTLKRNFINK